MAPLRDDLQRQIMIISVINLLLTVFSVTLQLHLVSFLQLTFQYQALKQQAPEAIQVRNNALLRYRQLRNRYLRKQMKSEKPRRHVNFIMSSKDFFNIEEQPRPQIKPRQNSFRGDTIGSFKKLAMTVYYLKGQGFIRMTSNAFHFILFYFIPFHVISFHS